MLAIRGIYDNGIFQLSKNIKTQKPTNVIITFIDDDFLNLEQSDNQENKINLNDFSFFKSIEATNDFSGSFCEALIDERRND